jgi:3alpha(or 20beta)-hydroxysteroid dehydrogenase
MNRLAGKVAIISGGARGLGAATARNFVTEGARVVLGDVLDAEGAAVAAELGPNARFVHLDVTSGDQWAEAVGVAEAEFGPVTALMNGAGIVDFSTLVDTSEQAYRRVLDVNQVGVFLGMRAVVDSMRSAGGGAIVNMSSTAGMQGYPGIFSYVATKWAVRGMTKAAALELAAAGIRVNSVHPGTIDTPMTAGLDADEQGAIVPMKRIGAPHEVAQLITYLVSDEAGYTTGTEHVIDGGVLAGMLAP